MDSKSRTNRPFRSRSRSRSPGVRLRNRDQERTIRPYYQRQRGRRPMRPRMHEMQRIDEYPPVKSIMDCALLSFRDFISTRDDSLKPQDAVTEYERYKEKYYKFNEDRFLKDHMSDEFIREKYHPVSYERLQEQRKLRGRLIARQFMQEMEDSNGFDGLRLVVSVPLVKRKKADKGRTWIDKADISISRTGLSEPPYFVDHPAAKSLVLETIHSDISRWQIYDALKETPGFAGVLISDPRSKKNLTRTAWLLFDTLASRDEAQEKFSTTSEEERITIDNFKLTFENPTLPLKCKAFVTPSCCCRVEVMERHLELAKKLIKKFDSDWQVWKDDLLATEDTDMQSTSEEQESWIDDKLPSETSTERKLDTAILYLRRVHNICFYNGKVCADEMHLWSTCGATHLRPEVSEEPDVSASEEEWLENLDSQLDKMLQLDINKKRQEQTAMIAQKWKAYCDEHILRVEEERYRCDLCRKLFKGPDFVAKHLKAKHASAYNEVVESVAADAIPKNFLEDPDRFVLYPTASPNGLLHDGSHGSAYLRNPMRQFGAGGDIHVRPDHVYNLNPYYNRPPVGMVGGYGRQIIPTYNDWDQPQTKAAFNNTSHPVADALVDSASLVHNTLPASTRPLVSYDDL